MIAVIDYGVGNLYSLRSSLEFLGMDVVITKEPVEIRAADKIILPGVGAFGDAMVKLRSTGLVDLIREQVAQGKFFLGICLGMQLLFEKSFEYGECAGLGLIPGAVVPLEGDLPPGSVLKVPHIGWNSLQIKEAEPIFRYIKNGDYVYYVHSFYAKGCEDNVIGSSEYGVDVTGVVRRGNVYGMQFHPEKSGKVGLDLLKAYCALE